MVTNQLGTLVLVVALISIAIVPAGVAAQPGDVDECVNANHGPGANGPPGFVADLVPDFIVDLIGALPVPNFVKAFFGASTC